MSDPSFIAPSLEQMNKLLSGYEFESELSANDIGAVYYARQTSLDRYVAVKLFSPAKGGDERFLASLKRSSKQVAKLKHPNLIGFIDSGMVDGMPFLVMEFVPGKSLHRSTHGHAIELKQARAVIGEVCAGLSHAHDQKVIHGNLSPLNILLNQKASPKIGNFALGRGIHTLPDAVVATHFSAPEVLTGEAHTVASDVYSLGAILYELITATPWQDGAPSASSLKGSPTAVDKVIEKACHKEPDQRFQSAKEFHQALEKAAKPKARPTAVVATPATRSRAMAMATSTTGTGIAVKAVIIVALLIAIKMVWDYREDVIERRKLASQNTEVTTKTIKTSKPADNFEMTRPPETKPPRVEADRPQKPEPDPIPVAPETPMESLERLRSALSDGNYSELPIGTVSHMGKHYFLVQDPMTWDEAVAHAGELGGTVALPTADMAWTEKEPIMGKSAWLGAGRSGIKVFTLLNGKEWQPQGPVAGSGFFVRLDGQGGLATAKANAQLPYVIEWSEGGKSLSFEERLAATASSLSAGTPVYPPGTVAVGERHYLAIPRSENWEKAVKIAESAGGHLMCISDDNEASQLASWRTQLSGSSSYWMGGRLLGEKWEWASGEPWRAVEWTSVINASKDGAAMILSPGNGVDAMNASSSADGLIIEWSNDPETNKATSGEELPPLVSPSDITDMAKQMVVKAIADKEEAHKKNTDKLAWDLNPYLRGMKKSDFEVWSPEVEKLKTAIQNNRISKENVEGTGARLSPFMAKLCNYLIRKQGEIDEEHVKSLQSIHSSYLKKLGEVRDQAKARGQVKAQVAATEMIDGSQNQDSWIAKMSAGAN